MAVDSFTGKLAVVTGGGSGMGRELVRQLAAQGCSVAACDLNADTVAETAATARAGAPPGVQVTGHACDVSDEAQVLRFRDELLEQHASDHVNLVFSNAGIGGGESFVKDSRGGVGAHLRHRLVGRVLLRPRVPAAADRQRRRRAGQHQQRERVLGVAGPGHAADRLQHGQVRRARASPRRSSRTCAPTRRTSGSLWCMPGHVGTNIVVNSLRARGLPDAGADERRPADGADPRRACGPR